MNLCCIRAVRGLHLSMAVITAAVLASIGTSPASAQPVVPLGQGSYYESVPAGQGVPEDTAGAPVLPRTTPNFAGPVNTNKWWSSLVWPRYPGNVYGSVMHPNPISVRASASGLEIASPRSPVFNSTDYYYEFNDQSRGFTLGVAGLTSADLRVDAAGDWSVSALWSAPSNGPTLRATFGRGMPFVYAEVTGGDALITFNATPGAPVVWANRGNVIGVSIGGIPYALFAPSGSTWTLTTATARSGLAGKGYYSVAALPEATTAALDLFQAHAFAFVTGTRATWSYNAATSTVDSTFAFDTVAKEGAQNTPLIALYRHQWLNSALPTTAYTYPSARGVMKLAVASEFTANMPFRGLVPQIPDVGAIAQPDLFALVDQQYQQSSLNLAADTYGAGRSYGKVAQLVYLADQAGHTLAKERFLNFLKDELEEWFRVGLPAGDRSIYSPIEAESYDAAQGVAVGPSPTGQAVTQFGNADYIRFNAVDFTTGSPATRLLLQYASTSGGSGLFQMRIDAIDGPIIAEGGVGGTGGQWIELPLGLASGASGVTGLHDVYITCSTPYEGELFRLDSFRLDRGGTPSDRYFAYHTPWSTLLGYPGSFGSTTEINDHHFHYGYFIIAASTIAQYDPAWAAESQLGGMVTLLIQDAANWDRGDTRFPFLRNFDPYAAHSYASGHAGFASGNNQESSSEAINFAAGVALWGASIGNETIRDLGLYIYANESAAIQQYWFDVDEAVYPAAAPKKIAGIVWDSGIAYATFFSAEPELIHGINFLPISSASLHLGIRPAQVLKSWNIMVAARGGPPIFWQFTNWCALALADPSQALALLIANPGYTPDGADTKAQMVHWISSLNALGTVDPNVTADWPHYAVFSNANARTFIAWNPTPDRALITFSTGRTLCIDAGETAVVRDADPSTTCCIADLDGNPGVDFGDFLFFFNCFDASESCADVDGTPGVDFGDFLAFFNAFDTGC